MLSAPVCREVLVLRAIDATIQRLAAGFALPAAVAESATWYRIDAHEVRGRVLDKAIGTLIAVERKRNSGEDQA
jgi:hypothetical protein